MAEISAVCIHCKRSFSYKKSGCGRMRRYCTPTCRARYADQLRGRRSRKDKLMACADCGQEMWRGSTSLPEGKARCLQCRRANPARDTVDLDKKREYDRRAQAKGRNRIREERGRPPLVPRSTPAEWNCEVCDTLIVGASLKSKPGRYCKRHRNHAKGHQKRARKYGVHYEYINPRTIYIRDGWKCGLCRKRVNQTLTYPNPMSASLDHVIPISRGGPHEPANVQCSHLSCNITKGNRGYGEQLALVG